jgi:alpha-beta hydrolase superfamily lysophospholipase
MLAGWIRAIRMGHIRVHAGLSIPVPTLVMHSDKSGGGKEWNESFTNSDCVLNVSEIQKYSSTLNNGHIPASVIPVQNGLHDLTCSRPYARAEFYSKLKAWLARL